MEGIVKDHLMSYLNKNQLIYHNQYGFLPRRSTNTLLLRYFNELTSRLEGNCQVDSIYLDYAKAFDSIVHSKLLFKLGKYGVSGNLLAWLSSFLNDRFQSVKVNNSYSNWSPVLSGVPQGSVLGPILFLIYINDLNTCCPELKTLYLFADDAKCFSIIKSVSDCDAFQMSLDSISVWSNNWQLTLAADKCQIISFSLNTVPLFDYTYQINSIPLLRVKEALDLGVIFSHDLSFSSHIKVMCNKARKKASIILNCFKSKDKDILFRAFVAFVRPIVDYCSNLWSPYRKSEIDLIESIQKRFTKRLFGMGGLPYSDRLKVLGTVSLERRRLVDDLCMYYKIFTELTDLLVDEFFILKQGVTRNNGASIYLKPFRFNSERYHFKSRGVNPWNSLPANVVQAGSLIAFKKCLVDTDLSKFMRNSYD